MDEKEVAEVFKTLNIDQFYVIKEQTERNGHWGTLTTKVAWIDGKEYRMEYFNG